MENIQDIIFWLSSLSWLYQSDANKELFIKKDLAGNNSDFFYFRFEDNLESSDFYENLYNEIKNYKIQQWILKDEESFSKNFNMIIFLRLDDEEIEVSEYIKKNIYWIEKNPYYSNKFIIPYKNKQIQSVTWKEIHDICSNFSQLSQLFTQIEKAIDDLWIKEKFILDVISNLHFLKVNYEIISGSNTVKSIYEESIMKMEEEFRNNLDTTSNPYEIIWKELKEIWEITDSENEISTFEKNIYALSKKLFKDYEDIDEDFESYLKNNSL